MPSSIIYRPWGSLEWVFSRARVTEWQFVGCLGTEERSVASILSLRHQAKVADECLVLIRDGTSRYRAASESRLANRKAAYMSGGGSASAVDEHLLMGGHSEIVAIAQRALSRGWRHIVLDVTSMPKRFFFPILRCFLESRDVESLVVTYTVPEKYTSGHLAEGHNEWAHLPLFNGGYHNREAGLLAVSVGFEPFGLVDQVEQEYSGIPVALLVPFPAPPSAFGRSLEVSSRLQRFRREGTVTSLRADAKDVSDAFSRLVSLAAGGRRIALAPFGPKPISVAMCIFATLTDSEVFYCQPTAYHPDYSVGVAMHQGAAQVFAYCVRLRGREFFAIA